MTDVYFSGTKAQAQAIKIGSSNLPFGAATWHCSDGTQQGIGATDGTCGEQVEWELVNGVMTISGEGPMDNYDSYNTPPWEMRKLEIQELVVEAGVTTIGSYAFMGCSNLSSMTLPEGIEEIGDYAFSECNFNGDIILPDGLERIDNYVFSSCTFNRIVIPDTVTEFGDCIIWNSYGKECILPKNIKEIPYGCCGYSHITKVTIPEGVETIKDSALAGTYIKEIYLPAIIAALS